MYKVSELISKPLLSIYGAKNCGIIGNVYFDLKISRGKILSLFTEDDSDVDVKYVDMRKIVSVDHDAATIKNCDCLTLDWNTLLDENSDNIKINPINSDVYNQDGKFLGILNDIILDGVKVISFEVDGISYDQNKFVSISDTILILNDTDKPVKLARPAKVPKTASGKVEINSVSQIKNIEINTAAVELPNKIPPSSTLVTRAPVLETPSEKYAFLMGKKLNTNIYDKRELLFKADSLIDESVISIARERGKLVQLALHATSNN